MWFVWARQAWPAQQRAEVGGHGLAAGHCEHGRRQNRPVADPDVLQSSLFGAAARVTPAEPPEAIQRLATTLRARYGDRLFLGTSSWYFPGWAGLVWAREYPQALLSREGLPAYAAHPLLRTVSLDRAFYRPLDALTYARLAAQVPESFRFVVKAPQLLCDATVRETGSGAPQAPNPMFLDPRFALESCAAPLVQGLGARLGALVLQVSPLPARWLDAPAEWLDRLAAVCRTLRAALPPPALLAVEVRDAELLTPELARVLKTEGVRCCLGLHARLPQVQDQLPLQRAMWPGDLVCRWNLHRGLRYAQARERWEPFDRLQAPDPATRKTLATVIKATLEAGHRAFVTINNKAEGSAPESVRELAQALVDLVGADPGSATDKPSIDV